ncbi:MAG TPA: hypothetical protein VH371_00260 [Candidatus Limnocylindrales bacterium]|jgi:hypothetical protein
MSDRTKFLVAIAAAIPLAFLGLISGLIMMAAVLFTALLTAVNFGRFAFAGIAIGVGATWALMFGLAAVNCAAPDQPCGATPVDLTPHITISLGLVLIGAVAALSGVRRNRSGTAPG